MGKNEFINSISSYDTNIMLAAIISLLVVILFVLLLHIYARWFFSPSPSPSSSSSSTSASVNSYTFNPPPSTFLPSPSKSKGLDPSLIASIPLFVFQEEEHEKSLECVICLSVFEENEIGRRLKKCGHGFHVECIDMWLNSHLNCPICRAPAAEFIDKEEDQIAIDQISGFSRNPKIFQISGKFPKIWKFPEIRKFSRFLENFRWRIQDCSVGRTDFTHGNAGLLPHSINTSSIRRAKLVECAPALPNVSTSTVCNSCHTTAQILVVRIFSLVAFQHYSTTDTRTLVDASSFADLFTFPLSSDTLSTLASASSTTLSTTLIQSATENTSTSSDVGCSHHMSLRIRSTAPSFTVNIETLIPEW
ncbi:uncharacterized protein [Euphorbia lathyris]|uniref:uncharacterized protein n=1 Tax=Euphorbia lathyris TaxID=212925 RepID=UPI003313325C